MHSLIKTLAFDGKELTLKQWAKELKVPYMTLYDRLRKGMPIEKVLSREFLEIGRPRKKE